MTDQTRTIRVFIGSPGDVRPERECVRRVIAEIDSSGLLTPKWSLKAIAWDSTSYPKVAWLPPQKAITMGMPRPSECDAAVFVLWSRIGTELTENAYPDDHRGDLGLDDVPNTGSVWEFCDAMHAGLKSGSPEVLVFHCKRPYPRVERAKRQEASDQQYAVEDLFAAFQDEARRSRFIVETYSEPEDLAASLKPQLEHIVRKITELADDTESPAEFTGGTDTPERPSAEYLSWLQNEVSGISLLGLDARDANTAQLRQVYVPALTQRPHDPDTEELRLSETPFALLLARHAEASLYVPGDPGLGKSTFARWAALVVAGGLLPAHTVPTPEDYRESFPEPLRGMLPVLCRLRDFYARIEWAPDTERWSANEMETALCAWVDRAGPPGLSGASLGRFLANGRVLLLLDGFDEVPDTRATGGGTAYPRAAILSGLAAVLPQWHARGHRVLLTSRPYGLKAAEVHTLGLEEARLQSLPDELQSLFIQRWFAAVDPPHAEEQASGLWEQIVGRSDLSEMRGNPMMLTALCVKYQEGRRLPKDVSELYDSLVNYVLHSRYAASARAVERVRRRLGVLALAMHCGRYVGERETAPPRDLLAQPEAEIDFDVIERVLRAYDAAEHSVRSAEERELAALDGREELLSNSGLLLAGGEHSANFYHLSLQDYLAAELLDRMQADMDAWLQRYAAEPRWRQTFGFWFARIASTRTLTKALAAVETLRNALQPQALAHTPQPAVLLADLLEVAAAQGGIGDYGPAFEQGCKASLRAAQDPAPRARLFQVLGTLGLDDRKGVGLTAKGLPDIDWIEIPGGDFIYQDGENRRNDVFWIARYPVTTGQFQAFLDAEDGYPDERWWQDLEDPDRNPAQPRWDIPNYPRETLSWFEAMAFCAWLSHRLGLDIRLPTEWQWERAARGIDGRAYPWGNDYRVGYANVNETRDDDAGPHNLGQATAVGIYLQGASPEGVLDLAGNLCEWCLNEYETPERTQRSGDESRVLRGGSWYGNQVLARAAFRRSNRPLGRDVDLGFRVVCASPIR